MLDFCKVVILRIGDFYHTKIAIGNISFTYDDNLLDLNPEGIGVQPMIASGIAIAAPLKSHSLFAIIQSITTYSINVQHLYSRTSRFAKFIHRYKG